MTFPGYPPNTIKPLMTPEGNGSSGVLVMAEALGEHEERDCLPLRPYAEAGSLFERALFRAGIARDSLTITNLVWYRPPNNELSGRPWEMDAIRACYQMNADVINRVKPKVIVALGGLAYRELTGLSGEKAGIAQTRGMITQGFGMAVGIPVIGTYHPSHLRRGSKERSEDLADAKVLAAGGGTKGMALLGVLIRDLQLAIKLAREGVPEWRYDDYQLGATLEEWEEFAAYALTNPGLPISYDWETPKSARVLSEEEIETGERERDITQGQMSIRSGQAIVSAFTPDLIPIWAKILSGPNPKLDWNGRKFDRPEAVTYGIRFGGELHDLMDMWHHTQPDLPRGLQYAASFFCPEVGPWKHLIGEQPLWYGALDVDVPQRIYEGLKRSSRMIREPHSGRSLYDGYHEQIVRLAPGLDRMTVRGQPVNNELRLGLDKEFEAAAQEINDSLQSLVPEDIRNVEPKEGYKRNNKLPKACLEAAGQAILWEADESTGDHSTKNGPSSERVVDEAGNIFVARTFIDSKTKQPVSRWARLLPFNTGSDQVKRYIKWKQAEEEVLHKKGKPLWYVPRSPKTNDETTDKLGLNRLFKSTGDPVIKGILDYREVQTAKGTFVEGWRPAKDGRVHSTFGFKPATGQLSSENPNAQNFSKHHKTSRAMMRMIEARPGHKFVRLDWKSFHVLTTGFEAQDPLYMRMSRIDMHSFFTLTGLLKLESPERIIELPDDELRAKLSWYKSQPTIYPAYASAGFPAGRTFEEIRDTQGKPTILGVGFGQTPNGMFKRNPDSFASLRQAKDTGAGLDRLFPLEVKWRAAVRREADAQAHLLTRYGYIRWFWDVFSRKLARPNEPGDYQDSRGRLWKYGPGDDHEAVVAFRPANDAFGMLRAVMVDLSEAGLDEKFQLINSVHDCLVLEPPDHLVDECVLTVKGMMEAPSPVLVDSVVAPLGLWCAVDVEIGRNLDRRDTSNPIGMEKIKL